MLWANLHLLFWLSLLPFLPEEDEVVVEDTDDLRRERAISVLQRMVTVEFVFNTQMMRVHVETESGQLSTTIANTLGELYVESGLESRLEATERATRWLTTRLGDLRAKLEASEKALQDFSSQLEHVFNEVRELEKHPVTVSPSVEAEQQVPAKLPTGITRETLCRRSMAGNRPRSAMRRSSTRWPSRIPRTSSATDSTPARSMSLPTTFAPAAPSAVA